LIEGSDAHHEDVQRILLNAVTRQGVGGAADDRKSFNIFPVLKLLRSAG
jgi:hypothetical protein